MGSAQNLMLIVEDEDRLRVMELATMCSVPMALKAAVQLNVPEIIHGAGAGAMLSAAEIVKKIPSTTPMASVYLDRILRVLASRDIFKEEVSETGRKYGSTALCKYLVKNDEKGASLGYMVLINQEEGFMKPWQFLHETVLDGGEPFTKAHGRSGFQLASASRDSGMGKLFNTTMSNHSRLYMQAILEAYDGFKSIKSSVVDVGGGIGTSLALVVSTYPHLTGINFDQPHVIATAPHITGVEHSGGDMFQIVPHGDAIFMKFVLHDWGDEACIKVLKNCYDALPSDGKVIVADAVLPSDVNHSQGARVTLSMDLLMLAYSSGGKERTREEFCKLANAAGFDEPKVIVTVDFVSILEFFKRT